MKLSNTKIQAVFYLTMLLNCSSTSLRAEIANAERGSYIVRDGVFFNLDGHAGLLYQVDAEESSTHVIDILGPGYVVGERTYADFIEDNNLRGIGHPDVMATMTPIEEAAYRSEVIYQSLRALGRPYVASSKLDLVDLAYVWESESFYDEKTYLSQGVPFVADSYRCDGLVEWSYEAALGEIYLASNYTGYINPDAGMYKGIYDFYGVLVNNGSYDGSGVTPSELYMPATLSNSKTKVAQTQADFPDMRSLVATPVVSGNHYNVSWNAPYDKSGIRKYAYGWVPAGASSFDSWSYTTTRSVSNASMPNIGGQYNFMIFAMDNLGHWSTSSSKYVSALVTYTPPPCTYTISINNNTFGGMVNGAGAKPCGSNVILTATPSACYIIYQWLLDGNLVQTGGTNYTISNIAADHSVQVVFQTAPQLAVTASSGGNGSINPAGSLVINCGDSQAFSAMPDSCNTVDKWYVGATVAQTGGTNFTLSNIQNDKTVQVTFKSLTYAINASASANGSISPAGSVAVNCSEYKIFTAIPNSNCFIRQWILDGQVVQVGGLTFNVQDIHSSHTLRVMFDTTEGSYNGLFYETNGVRHESSGFFTAKTTSKGTFTAKIQLAGKSYSFKGLFNSEGKSTNSIARTSLTAELQLDFSGKDQISGRISDGVWSAYLLADKAVFNSKTNPAPQAGKYTMRILGSPDSTASPGGHGFGTVTIDAAGKISLKGALGDGTKISQKTVLSKDGHWPLYGSLYKRTGSILSWVTFTNDLPKVLGGDLSWVKRADPRTKLYAAGFTNETIVSGSGYAAPLAGNRILDFSASEVSFDVGNLAQNFTNLVFLGTDNKLINNSSNKLTLTMSLPTGLFKGKGTDPMTGKTISFQGALLQGTNFNFGSGYFLGTNQSGQVIFKESE